MFAMDAYRVVVDPKMKLPNLVLPIDDAYNRQTMQHSLGYRTNASYSQWTRSVYPVCLECLFAVRCMKRRYPDCITLRVWINRSLDASNNLFAYQCRKFANPASIVCASNYCYLASAIINGMHCYPVVIYYRNFPASIASGSSCGCLVWEAFAAINYYPVCSTHFAFAVNVGRKYMKQPRIWSMDCTVLFYCGSGMICAYWLTKMLSQHFHSICGGVNEFDEFVNIHMCVCVCVWWSRVTNDSMDNKHIP